MRRFFQSFIVLVSALFLFTAGAAPALAASTDCGATSQSIKEQLQNGANCASGKNQTPAQAGTSLENTIKSAINILTILVGAVAVIMIIFAGLRYITSAGNEQSTTAAKRTLLYAIVGLVIVSVAQIVVHFVLNRVTKATNSSSSSSSGKGLN